MSDREFSIGGRDFKLCKIDAFKQFHIVRRIGPILSDIIPSLGEAKKVIGKSTEEQLEAFAKIANPVMNGLSKLSDADSEMVLFNLLAAVEVKQATGNYAKVSNGSMLMIQDLELPVMLQLAGRALVYNLSGFFSALPAK